MLSLDQLPVFSQNDPRWKNDHYGYRTAAIDSTIGAYGCAISCVAMKLIRLPEYTRLTPQFVNTKLVEDGGYVAGGSNNFVNWVVLPKIFPPLMYNGREDFGEAGAPLRVMLKIVEQLRRGEPVIVYVDASKYEAGLQQHFVLIAGARPDGSLIIDNPWNGKRQDFRPYADEDARAIRGVKWLDFKPAVPFDPPHTLPGATAHDAAKIVDFDRRGESWKWA